MAKWTGKKVNVAYIKPEEPKFLKAFKEKVGYKEDREVLAAKFAAMPSATDDDLEDGEEEQPQVVMLHTGDISQEEYDKLRREGRLSELIKDKSKEDDKESQEISNDKDDPKIPEDGRIIFKPISKRSHTENDESEIKEKKRKKEKKEKNNKTLLSFNEDEEEEF